MARWVPAATLGYFGLHAVGATGPPSEPAGAPVGSFGEIVRRAWHRLVVRPSWEERPIEVQEFADRGRGWVARRPIQRGDLLLAVPAEATIAVPLSDDSEAKLALRLLQILEGGAGRLRGRGLLRRRQRAFNEEFVDCWREYTTAAYPEVQAAAAFWKREEINEVQWPPAVAQISAYAAQTRRAVRRVAAAAGVPPSTAKWAVGAVISRSFAVEGLGRVLAPLADLFNHRPQSPAAWAAACDADPDLPETPWALSSDGLFEMRAASPAAVGEEVLMSYGEDAGAELLAVHGFTLDPLQDNPADFVELVEDFEELVNEAQAFELDNDPQMQPRDWGPRLAILESGPAADMPLAVRPGGLLASEHLISSLEVALAPDDQLDLLEEVWSDHVGHALLCLGATAPPDLRSSLRRSALAVATGAVRLALARMPAVDEDVQWLARHCPDEAREPLRARPSRQELAVRYRMGVKRLLTDFLSVATSGGAA